MMREPAFTHSWRSTRKPHRARGRAPLRQRLMLAIQAHLVVNHQPFSWMVWSLHSLLLRALYVSRRR